MNSKHSAVDIAFKVARDYTKRTYRHYWHRQGARAAIRVKLGQQIKWCPKIIWF